MKWSDVTLSRYKSLFIFSFWPVMTKLVVQHQPCSILFPFHDCMCLHRLKHRIKPQSIWWYVSVLFICSNWWLLSYSGSFLKNASIFLHITRTVWKYDSICVVYGTDACNVTEIPFPRERNMAVPFQLQH